MNGLIRNKKLNSIKQDDLLFWFSVVDILFLPYFTFMSISYSVPFILVWLLLNYRELIRGRERKYFFIMLFCMVASTLISPFYTQPLRFETTFVTSLKRLVQYISCFGYYCFFRSYFKKNKVDIEKLLFWFVIYVFIFSILFLVMPQEYAEIKLMIHPADNHTRRYLAGSVYYRFNYLWTDPNNIAYLIDGIIFYIWLNSKMSMTKKILITVMGGSIMLTTASNGGLIIYGLVIAILLLRYITYLIKNAKMKLSNIVIWCFFACVLIFCLSNENIRLYIQVELFDKLVDRLNYYLSSGNVSGGRGKDLETALEYINPLLLLVGVGKEGFSSENGHIYWIGMYGLPAYVCYMYIVFSNFRMVSWKKYIWILPFFVAFTMNIAIGEFKWFAIYLMILAYSRYSVDINAEERVPVYEKNRV